MSNSDWGLHASRSCYNFALALRIPESDTLEVVSSPVHKVGDVTLQLQVKPSQLVGPVSGYGVGGYPVHLLCGWPWADRAPSSVSERVFNKKWFCHANVTFHHLIDTQKSITKPIQLETHLNLGSSRRGVDFKLASSLNTLREAGWLGCGDHLLVTVEIAGDLDVLKMRGIGFPTDNLFASMWHDMHFADFHIAARGQDIRCHRSVLAAASPVFRAMLESDMQEGFQTFASIDEQPSDISSMLQFIYTERLPDNMDCLSTLRLLRIADCYELPKLFQVCKSLVLPKVTHDNIVDILKNVSLLESLPGCGVIKGLLLHEVQRNFHLVKTVVEQMVQTQLEHDATLQFQPNVYNPTTKVTHVGTQCGDCGDVHVVGEGEGGDYNRVHVAPPRMQESNLAASSDTTCVAPHSLHRIATTIQRSSLLRMKTASNSEEQGNHVNILLQERAEDQGNPRRKTRRGRRNGNEAGNLELASSLVTHDSWR